MSKDEQVVHSRQARKVFAELITDNEPFKMYFANRPIDLQKNQDFQIYLLNKTDESDPRYELIKARNSYFGVLSTTGKAQEGECYIMFYAKNKDNVEKDLLKRLSDFKNKVSGIGYKSKILNNEEIKLLVNSYNNPITAYQEEYSIDKDMPLSSQSIKGVRGREE
jgi:hypothetical protein